MKRSSERFMLRGRMHRLLIALPFAALLFVALVTFTFNVVWSASAPAVALLVMLAWLETRGMQRASLFD